MVQGMGGLIFFLIYSFKYFIFHFLILIFFFFFGCTGSLLLHTGFL